MPSTTNFSLAGRRALVTGSSQGIGLSLARGLAEAGATVILNGRNEAKLAATVESLRRLGHTVESAAFDVSRLDSVEPAIGRLLSDGRAIDILVNNAGINIRAPLLEMTPENWQKVIDTNLTSAFLVARAVAPGMIARKAGKIVNICSLGSDLARATTGPYCSAKGGLRMLTRMMCVEWAHANVQVNGISPGYILTELVRPLSNDPKFNAWVLGHTPAGRWGEPDDLIGACIFLCSPAANFVNGHLLYVDGGFSITS
ncbi:MAG: SDR family oxidoreductase [Opitutaceae bacterium]|nr:SDR family oxidoreductase [Opitutaceae bacterium]